jgi:hypothetical protein
MESMKDIMLKNGIDLETIRKEFYASCDDCIGSINTSKGYIVVMCHRNKLSIWDLVKHDLDRIDNDDDFTDYQKEMTKASLLLAWEDLEKDNAAVSIKINKYSRPEL